MTYRVHNPYYSELDIQVAVPGSTAPKLVLWDVLLLMQLGGTDVEIAAKYNASLVLISNIREAAKPTKKGAQYLKYSWRDGVKYGKMKSHKGDTK